MSTEEIEKLVITLEEEMFAAAEELRFEYAAKLRDEIKDLRRELLAATPATLRADDARLHHLDPDLGLRHRRARPLRRPGPDPMPIWMTTAIGIGGSLIGGILSRLLFGTATSFFFAFLGAVLLVVPVPEVRPAPADLRPWRSARRRRSAHS
jgi:hypothetical protein